MKTPLLGLLVWGKGQILSILKLFRSFWMLTKLQYTCFWWDCPVFHPQAFSHTNSVFIHILVPRIRLNKTSFTGNEQNFLASWKKSYLVIYMYIDASRMYLGYRWNIFITIENVRIWNNSWEFDNILKFDNFHRKQ